MSCDHPLYIYEKNVKKRQASHLVGAQTLSQMRQISLENTSGKSTPTISNQH
jgi:hypothetical protein